MTLASMTGFARVGGTLQTPSGAVEYVFEARSVNARGMDMRFRLPPGLDAVEVKARKMLTEALVRGSVNVTLTMGAGTEAPEYAINHALLDLLIATARDKAALGADAVQPARLDGLLAVRGVVMEAGSAPGGAGSEAEGAAQREATEAALLATFADLVAALQDARLSEGTHLRALLADLLDQVADLTGQARGCATTRPEALRAKLAAQIADMLGGDVTLSEERLAQETAVLASKADVREELDRLDAHVAAARDLLEKGSPCGRKLDFLTQELNREANTLCSKAADMELTRLGLALKAVVDQIKEQVQNVA